MKQARGLPGRGVKMTRSGRSGPGPISGEAGSGTGQVGDPAGPIGQGRVTLTSTRPPVAGTAGLAHQELPWMAMVEEENSLDT